MFRRLFLEALEKAYAAGKLQFFGDLEPLRDPTAFARYLAPLRDTSEWVVYAKAPFGGPQHVLEYLGRYTHRVAISNRRLLALENGQVSFEWKDYRDAGKSKVMTVSAEEFIRRFLQHALPPGFQRIRYYGFLANCHRAAKLTLCRQLLATACSLLLPQPADCRDLLAALTRTNLRLCPQCGKAILLRRQFFPPITATFRSAWTAHDAACPEPVFSPALPSRQGILFLCPRPLQPRALPIARQIACRPRSPPLFFRPSSSPVGQPLGSTHPPTHPSPRPQNTALETEQNPLKIEPPAKV